MVDARSLQLAFQSEIEIGASILSKQVRDFFEMRAKGAASEQPKQMAQHQCRDRKTPWEQRDGPFGPHLGAGESNELNIDAVV